MLLLWFVCVFSFEAIYAAVTWPICPFLLMFTFCFDQRRWARDGLGRVAVAHMHVLLNWDFIEWYLCFFSLSFSSLLIVFAIVSLSVVCVYL